jgi:mono/diheme cytochrome c family protein
MIRPICERTRRRGEASRRVIYVAICLWGLCWPVAFGQGRLEEGPKLYQLRCAVCHGVKGDGRGPAAPSLNPKPMDFTSGLYKYRSTAWGSPPLDSDLERTIREGLRGTAMPGWGDVLSPEEVRELIETLKTFSPAMFRTKAMPVSVPAAAFHSANRDIGKTLFGQKGCASCHGQEGSGDGPLSNQLYDIRGKRAFPRDLTDHRNYRWGASPQDIYLRIATGLNGTPMQGYANHMSPQEIQHVTAYLKSLYEDAETTRWLNRPSSPEPLHRGEYLKSVMVCQLCHTPINPDASYREDLHLAGGMKVSATDGLYYSRNLTPDPESGLGNWSIEEVRMALTRGTGKNNRLLYPFDMPWLFFSNLTDQDAEAIAMYLKSLTPIYNKIAPPQPSGFWASLSRKTRFLFGGERTLQYHVGNFGERDPGKGKSIPVAEQGYWSVLPPIGWIPVEQVIKRARPELPVPPPSGSAVEEAKRQRGRYLVSIAPCALCHTPTVGTLLPKASPALSGGLKISCGADITGCFGTVYAKNLTSDRETGLGGWTDQQIKRAVKSGITKDGRLMHWQAMPWDIFSNFTEADLEAIVAYLRSLPPVRKTIPPPVPSAPPGYLINLGRDYGTMLRD